MDNSCLKRPICRTVEEVEEWIETIFFDEEHTLKECIGGQYIQQGSFEEMMKQFTDIREKYHSPAGIQAIRMVMGVKHTEEAAIGLDGLYKMSEEICSLYPDYQMMFGFYRAEEILKVYFVLNTVAVNDGRKFNPTMEEYYEIVDKKKIIGERYAKEAVDLQNL